MIDPPIFFELIRQQAAQLCDQIESNPELKGQRHQLFTQVQDPRYILSELLQNADDARATEASVCIENGAFIFKHNGDDFTKEHFASLCRFGYSNKRALHTIGFRGLGFKSTFSLGERVELFTPTLSVAFHQDRFTEPKWVNEGLESNGLTIVRVAISDEHRRVEVEKNLDDWLNSPVSLLFFKHIHRIRIGERDVHWGSIGPGPVKNTEWWALQDKDDEPYLIARSNPEPFPKEVLEEIKKVRRSEGDTDFSDCIVEIVMGMDGRLFVVLPTGVKTALPFSCNAPFIQDPARLNINSPVTSLTNKWLLQRAGKLAAETMLEWLNKPDSNPLEKARAYDLMPDVNHDDNSLEGVCGSIVEKAFAEVIESKEFLLTDEGQLTHSKKSIIIPDAILDVWPSAQASAFFDDDGRPAFSRHVLAENKQKLLNWDEIEEINETGVLDVLQDKGKHLPKPKSWHHLLGLWTYLAPVITKYSYYGEKKGLCIVPVQSKKVLYAADKIVRLGEKKLLPSGDDWRFLGDRLSVLDQNWLRYLTKQRSLAETNEDKELSERVDAAYAVLKAISLDEFSDTGKVIDQVASAFFKQETVTLADAIRIAQIAAKLGARIGGGFHYVCQDGSLRSAGETILFDADGTLNMLLPEKWNESHLLHPEYLNSFSSCTREEWLRWISNGRSSLHTFVPLVSKPYSMSLDKVGKILKQRGYKDSFKPSYTNPSIRFNDWGFEEDIWEYWEKQAEDDDSIWVKITEKILTEPDRFWSDNLSATVTEEASNGREKRRISNGLMPIWIFKLREKECLQDTHGNNRKPEDLLRRTSETEALLGVESFIHSRHDNESSRPLLKLFGVSDVPTGPGKLLDRLQYLAGSTNPPTHEIDKWYRRLDQLLKGCSTEDFFAVKTAFRNEKLVLTENGIWENSSGVFLASDGEDAPDAETVRASVKELVLWRRIGVAERPTADLTIDWLLALPSGEPLSQNQARRVRSSLKQHPDRIWNECNHWINLEGEWARIDNLDFALTMQPLISWKHLDNWVKQKTADFQQLSFDILSDYPFSGISLLSEHVDDRFDENSSFSKKFEERPWLKQLGVELCRINLDKNDEKVKRIRNLGGNLSLTTWRTIPSLKTIPYIDGKRAGKPRPADALWSDKTLYVEDRPPATLARAVSEELNRSFRDPDITEAIKFCFERAPEFVTSYMEQNFKLIPREVATSEEEREVETEQNPDKGNSVDDTDANDFNHGHDKTTNSDNITSTNTHPTIPASTGHSSPTTHGNTTTKSPSRRGHKSGIKVSPEKFEGHGGLVFGDSDLDGESTPEAKRIGDLGEKYIFEHLKHDYKDANLLGGNNKGYDIEYTINGVKHFVEVKTLSESWQGHNDASLTKSQFEKAWEAKDRYSLYVVENAENEKCGFYCINDPASHFTTIHLDDGWKDFATLFTPLPKT